MAIFIFSLAFIQIQLATAYLFLNLALISLTLSKSFSHVHTFLSHSILFSPFRLIFTPLASRAQCVLAHIKKKLARIAMRLVSNSRSNGSWPLLDDHEARSERPAMLTMNYGTDSELFGAYQELMNAQNLLFLAEVRYLMRVFFIIPLSLFCTATEERAAIEEQAHDQNEQDKRIPPTSEAPLKDPVPDKPPSDDINSKNLPAGLVPISSSGGMVHAARKRREVLIWQLRKKYRLIKIYTT